ncbi:MAG: HAMP domain-containing protein [Acidobacteria bacterium]|nr:HAMP domain-containing protein [Acidobacteriota bacterium]MBI3656050.1 HAMP domain-containing protein [Acidobacteriota bacterium]
MDIKVTLRTKLLFFSFLISALPLLSLLTFISFQIRAQTQRRIQESLRVDLNVARGLLEQRVDEVQAMASSVADLAASYNFGGLAGGSSGGYGASHSTVGTQRGRGGIPATRSQFYALMDRFLSNWKFDTLVITDAHGRVVYRANQPDSLHDDLHGHVLVSSALQGKKAGGLIKEAPERVNAEGLHDRALVSRSGQPPQTPGSNPAEAAGMFVEAVAPILDIDDKVIGCVLTGDLLNNDFTLVDGISEIVYRDRPGVGAVSITLDDYIISSNLNTGEGRALGRTVLSAYDGIDKKAGLFNSCAGAQESLKDPGGQEIGKLHVAVKAYWYQQWENEFRRRILLVTLSFLLFFLAIAYLVTRLFTRSIIDVVHASDRVSLGELETVVQATTGDEVEVLAESIERMRLSLKAALDRLKRV